MSVFHQFYMFPFPADPVIFCNSNSKILLLLVSVNLQYCQFIAFIFWRHGLSCPVWSEVKLEYHLKHNFTPRCTQLENIMFAYIRTVVGKLSPYCWICHTPDLEVFTSYLLRQRGIYNVYVSLISFDHNFCCVKEVSHFLFSL